MIIKQYNVIIIVYTHVIIICGHFLICKISSIVYIGTLQRYIYSFVTVKQYIAKRHHYVYTYVIIISVNLLVYKKVLHNYRPLFILVHYSVIYFFATVKQYLPKRHHYVYITRNNYMC